jgi:hypothetical protein
MECHLHEKFHGITIDVMTICANSCVIPFLVVNCIVLISIFCAEWRFKTYLIS